MIARVTKVSCESEVMTISITIGNHIKYDDDCADYTHISFIRNHLSGRKKSRNSSTEKNYYLGPFKTDAFSFENPYSSMRFRLLWHVYALKMHRIEYASKCGTFQKRIDSKTHRCENAFIPYCIVLKTHLVDNASF